MTEIELRNIFRDFKADKLTENELLAKFRESQIGEMDFAKVDYGREIRQGFPEVIYAEGKTKEQTAEIFLALANKSEGCVMATRANIEKFEAVQKLTPNAKYDEAARIIYLERNLKIVDESR